MTTVRNINRTNRPAPFQMFTLWYIKDKIDIHRLLITYRPRIFDFCYYKLINIESLNHRSRDRMIQIADSKWAQVTK